MAPVSVPQSDSAAATASAVAWVSWKPAGPVQALAPPELRITARSRPVVSTCWVHSTGAALTLLRVNTPAARVVGALVEHQRQVERAGCLDACGDSGGAEARGRGHALGADQPGVDSA